MKCLQLELSKIVGSKVFNIMNGVALEIVTLGYD